MDTITGVSCPVRQTRLSDVEWTENVFAVHLQPSSVPLATGLYSERCLGGQDESAGKTAMRVANQRADLGFVKDCAPFAVSRGAMRCIQANFFAAFLC